MNFEQQINNFNRKALDKTNKTIRGTAIDLFSKIIQRTPVGNANYWIHKRKPKGYVGGRLRNNWFCTIGKASNKTTKSTNYKSATSRVLKTISKATDINKDYVFYLSNNLDYAQKIEDGKHSKQAKKGMVKITLTEFNNIVKANR